MRSWLRWLVVGSVVMGSVSFEGGSWLVVTKETEVRERVVGQ